MAIGSDANIRAVITAKDDASHVLKKFGDETASTSNKLAAGLKVAAVGAAAAGAAAIAFGVMSVKAYQESENAIAQTNAVLKSTGGVAGVSAQQVTELATSLQKVTKYSDEDVRSVENLLLTFTSIGKDIFPQATSTVLDMATALGEDTKSASIQLGKALQDPILGITALRRVGVNFSDAQKDVITNLVETGHKAEAQKLILKELQKEFGGSAEAAGNTFAGSLEKLKNKLNDVEEIVGKVITDRLQPFVAEAANFVASIDWEATINKTVIAMQNFGTQVGAFLDKVKSIGIEVFNFLKPSLEALADTFINKLLPAFMQLWTAIEPGFTNALKVLGTILGVGLVAEAWLYINVLNVIWSTVGFLIQVTKNLVNTMVDAWNWIVAKAMWVKDNFALVVGSIIGFFATLPIMMPFYVGVAISKIIGFVASINWGGVFSGIWRAMQGVWDMVVNTAVNAWHRIRSIDWGSVASGIGKGFANGIIGIIESALKSAVRGLPGNIESKISLPRFAGGVQNFSGGLAVVGEQGAEIVNLPKGSDVIPNHQIGAGSPVGGGTVNITIQAGAFMGSDVEARKFAQTILDHLKDVASSKSTTVGAMIG